MFRLSSRCLRAGLLLPVAALAVAVPSATAQPVAHPTTLPHLVQHPVAHPVTTPRSASVVTAHAAPSAPAPVTIHRAAVSQTPPQVTALSWSQAHVDATSGTVTNNVTWKVDNPGDTSPSSTDLSGEIDFGLVPASGQHQPFQYRVTFPGNDVFQLSHVGTVTTYIYQFTVPKYAASTTGTWAVTSLRTVSAANGEVDLTGDQLAASFPSTFTSTSIADTAPPSLDRVTADPYSFAWDGSGVLAYTAMADDFLSGVNTLSVTVTGPGGRTLSQTVKYPSGIGQQTGVGFDVSPPFDGTWRITEIDLTDNVGNFATFNQPTPIVLTDDSVIKAGGFTAPSPVDDWSAQQTVPYTMQVTDSAAAVTSVSLVGDRCIAGTPTFPGSGGGTLTIPITMPVATLSCGITGVILTDAAGNTSVYGAYGENTVLPDITAETGAPPTATNFRLSTTQVSLRQRYTNPLTLSMDVSSWGPGVIEACVGSPQRINVFPDCLLMSRQVSGTVTVSLDGLANARPGTYQLAVTVWDAAHIRTDITTALTVTIPGSLDGSQIHGPLADPNLR